jgi:hypothetical protein
MVETVCGKRAQLVFNINQRPALLQSYYSRITFLPFLLQDVQPDYPLVTNALYPNTIYKRVYSTKRSLNIKT